MFWVNQTLDSSQVSTTKSVVCLTQEESDAIFNRSRRPGLAVIHDYIDAGVAIRLVYASEKYASAARNERDYFKKRGVDILVSPAEGVFRNGSSKRCRIDIFYPYS